MPDERAVFAEPLAAAFEILEQIAIEPGVRCIVLGDGKLGLLVAQVLHAAGAQRDARSAITPAKLAVLARRGIATARAGALAGEPGAAGGRGDRHRRRASARAVALDAAARHAGAEEHRRRAASRSISRRW